MNGLLAINRLNCIRLSLFLHVLWKFLIWKVSPNKVKALSVWSWWLSYIEIPEETDHLESICFQGNLSTSSPLALSPLSIAFRDDYLGWPWFLPWDYDVSSVIIANDFCPDSRSIRIRHFASFSQLWFVLIFLLVLLLKIFIWFNHRWVILSDRNRWDMLTKKNLLYILLGTFIGFRKKYSGFPFIDMVHQLDCPGWVGWSTWKWITPFT